MTTLVEIVENNVVQEPQAEVQPGTTQSDDTAVETQLTEEISTLWADHVRLSADRKTTAKELRRIRASLAERLHEMKNLLSHPGRGGEWRGWLRERGIPRSTADRLCARHAETLGSDNEENVPSGAIPEPAKPTAEKLAETVWQSIKKVLATGDSVVDFIACIARISGVPYEEREIGLMIFYPVPKAADELSSSASAPGPVPQPSDDASGNTGEQAAETVMATPATEVLAGIANATNGDVL